MELLDDPQKTAMEELAGFLGLMKVGGLKRKGGEERAEEGRDEGNGSWVIVLFIGWMDLY